LWAERGDERVKWAALWRERRACMGWMGTWMMVYRDGSGYGRGGNQGGMGRVRGVRRGNSGYGFP
jgi:hypothetical protein